MFLIFNKSNEREREKLPDDVGESNQSEVLTLSHFLFLLPKDIVKACFSDPEFNARHRLGAINSINIARILAQITYYFSSYFELKRQLESQGIKDLKAEDLQYVVPTGNFGDILAGYYAKRMGLPVRNLVVAPKRETVGLILKSRKTDS